MTGWWRRHGVGVIWVVQLLVASWLVFAAAVIVGACMRPG